MKVCLQGQQQSTDQGLLKCAHSKGATRGTTQRKQLGSRSFCLVPSPGMLCSCRSSEWHCGGLLQDFHYFMLGWHPHQSRILRAPERSGTFHSKRVWPPRSSQNASTALSAKQKLRLNSFQVLPYRAPTLKLKNVFNCSSTCITRTTLASVFDPRLAPAFDERVTVSNPQDTAAAFDMSAL